MNGKASGSHQSQFRGGDDRQTYPVFNSLGDTETNRVDVLEDRHAKFEELRQTIVDCTRQLLEYYREAELTGFGSPFQPVKAAPGFRDVKRSGKHRRTNSEKALSQKSQHVFDCSDWTEDLDFSPSQEANAIRQMLLIWERIKGSLNPRPPKDIKESSEKSQDETTQAKITGNDNKAVDLQDGNNHEAFLEQRQSNTDTHSSEMARSHPMTQEEMDIPQQEAHRGVETASGGRKYNNTPGTEAEDTLQKDPSQIQWTSEECKEEFFLNLRGLQGTGEN